MVKKYARTTRKKTTRMTWWGRLIMICAISSLVTSCLKDKDRCPEGTVLIKKTASRNDINWFDVCIVPPDTERDSSSEIPLDGGSGDGGSGESNDGGDADECGECKDGEYCDTTLDPPACLPPPTGQGETCNTDADCAEFEANYCEKDITNTCLIQHCNVEANNCSPGYMCCDFSWYDLPTTCVSMAVWGSACYEPDK
jgi:hypothetical protein